MLGGGPHPPATHRAPNEAAQQIWSSFITCGFAAVGVEAPLHQLPLVGGHQRRRIVSGQGDPLGAVADGRGVHLPIDPACAGPSPGERLALVRWVAQDALDGTFAPTRLSAVDVVELAHRWGRHCGSVQASDHLADRYAVVGHPAVDLTHDARFWLKDDAGAGRAVLLVAI